MFDLVSNPISRKITSSREDLSQSPNEPKMSITLSFSFSQAIRFSLTAIFFVAQLSSSTAAEKELRDEGSYLVLSDSELVSLATGGNKIGACYIEESFDGNCRAYVTSGIQGDDDKYGWPKTIFYEGNGCISGKPINNSSSCPYNAEKYPVSSEVALSFCSSVWNQNAAAVLRNAIEKHACLLVPIDELISGRKLSLSGSFEFEPVSKKTSIKSGSFRQYYGYGYPSNPPHANPFRPAPILLPSPSTSPSPVLKPVDLPEELVLDTVKHCRSCRVSCQEILTNSHYSYFGAAGMDVFRQRRLYISEINTPPRTQAKNIVFVVSGQQFIEPLIGEHGISNGVTGQMNNFAKGFSRTTGSRRVPISSDNMASWIMAAGYMDPSKTFIGAVFEARFNYELSRAEKNKHEEGYYRYLLSRVGDHPETIYLAGHSRGGCLVMRLASRLTRRFTRTKVVVHTWDPVCTHERAGGVLTEEEFGVGKPEFNNPVASGRYVYSTDMNVRFLRRNCLAIRNFLAGDSVITPKIRGFGHSGASVSRYTTGSLRLSNGFAWYNQSYHTQSHNSIDNFHHEAASKHFQISMNSLGRRCKP